MFVRRRLKTSGWSYDITQSTVSRDLRRIGAVKTTNAEGEIIYVLPEDHQYLRPKVEIPVQDLVDEIVSNEALIVVHTVPGAASLVARHIDSIQETLGVIATIAGDDSVLVVPQSTKKISSITKKLEGELY